MTTTTPMTSTLWTGPITRPTKPPRVCDCNMDVCIQAISGASDHCGSEHWSGHEIEVLQNNHVIGMLPAGFENHKICIYHEKVDIINDVFELRRTGNNGVSKLVDVLSFS